MKDIMPQEPPRESNVCTQGSIHWAPNDPYVRVMGAEYPGRVRGMGVGPTPGRSSSYTSQASTSASHEPELLSQVNRLQAQVMQMQTSHQNQLMHMETMQNEITELRKMLQVVREEVGNYFGVQGNNVGNINPDTGSPPVRSRSSVGSQSGLI
jgi:DNA-binding transcriptional regulator YiaG